MTLRFTLCFMFLCHRVHCNIVFMTASFN